MNALYRVVSLLLLGTVAALACGKPTSGGGNSNTNWLHGCTGSGECGILECLCGRCTVACSRATDCAEFGADAVCASGSNLEASCGERTVCMRTRDRKDDASTPVDGSTGAEGAAPPPDGPDDASLESGARTRIDSGLDGRVPSPDFEDGSVVGIDTVYGCAAIRHRPGASFQTTGDVLPPVPPLLVDAPRTLSVSASGVVVGQHPVDVVRLPGTPSTESFLLYRPFLWTEEGVRDVVLPDGFYMTSASPWTPSCDATVLVGGTYEAEVVTEKVVTKNFRASKWSESGGLVHLPPADDVQLDSAYRASAGFVDADGSTILGARQHFPTSGVDQVFATRWEGDGRAIETDFGVGNAFNQGISADGRVVVGSNSAAVVTGGAEDVLVWTEGTPLSTVHLDGVFVRARAMTADGSAVYGTGTGCHPPDWECTPDGNGAVRAAYHAFVWTRAAGPLKLAGLREVAAVSATGVVIAGTADDGAAAVWDSAHGVRKLVDVLATHGVSVPSEWIDLHLDGMSQDARIFAGRVRRQGETGEPSELFRVSLPADAFR